MTREQRDELLEAVTGDVVDHVLYDSFLQAQIIGQEVERSAGRMYAYEDLMHVLEEEGLLDRASEDLPDGEEIAERRRSGRGMERPELAILVAYAKRWIARHIEDSDLVDDPWLERDLREYFPGPVVERCEHLLSEHPLRKQLLCMSSANSVVNALGPTFVSQLVAERGSDPAAVVRAYRIARAVTGAAARWDTVERLTDVEPAAQAELMTGIDQLVDAVTRWFLVYGPSHDMTETVEAGRAGFQQLVDVLPELGTDERRAGRHELADGLALRGVPEPVAAAAALREDLLHAPDMIAVAGSTGRDLREVADVFYRIGDVFRLDWLESELQRVRSVGRMQRWALQAVREDAFLARRELAEHALAENPDSPPEQAVEAFLAAHETQRRRVAAFLRALTREGEPDLAGFTLAVRQLRTIVE
jgi:glutamate dehydrogenase